MIETLEQIALRIAGDIWGSPHAMDVEFAKRLVEALNDRNPDAYWCKHGLDEYPYKFVTHNNIEAYKWLSQFDGDIAEVIPLYAAPRIEP